MDVPMMKTNLGWKQCSLGKNGLVVVVVYLIETGVYEFECVDWIHIT